MKHAVVLLFAGACGGARTQTVTLVTTPVDASTPIEAGAIDAAAVEAGVRSSAVPQPTASEPWCNEKYDVLPCVFAQYGSCWLREKNPADPADPYAYSHCPAGAAPAFMTRPRACGRKSTEPIAKRNVSYVPAPQQVRCSAIATKWANVVHEERTCASDADCQLVVHGCLRAGLNKTAAALEKYGDEPCGNPAAGMCAPPNDVVRCASGCCILSGGTSSPFGTIDAAYPRIAPP